jgi:hypothetical protein
MKEVAVGAFAPRFAESSAAALDSCRSYLLRVSMNFNWARPFFYRRWLRLAVLFTFFSLFALGLSLAFPLWMLFLGPLIYGIPHIYASLRYVHFTAAGLPARDVEPVRLRTGHRFFASAMFILVCVASYRVFVTLNVWGFMGLMAPQLSEWSGSNYVELIALGVTFVLGALIYRLPLSRLGRGTALLVVFAAVFVRYPIGTIGAMVLVHNFVAFPFWIRAAQSRAERWVAWFALSATAALTAAIFSGSFDWIYHYFAPGLVLDFAQMSVKDTGRLIFPYGPHGLESETLWLHACVAFAFGQALHYFVWLKAIPDQCHYHEVPTSFRQSLRLLERDFGKIAALLIIGLSLGAIVFWSFLSFQMARFIYFAVASYHGYLEIAGLALMKSGPRHKP